MLITTYKPTIAAMNEDNSILKINIENNIKYYSLEKKWNKLLVIKEYNSIQDDTFHPCDYSIR